VVTAGDFFVGASRTLRQPDEILTAVELPLLPEPGAQEDAVGVAFIEQRRTHLSFAQVSVVASLALRDGAISRARIGMTGGANRRAHDAETYLLGREPEPAVFARAGELAAAAADPYPEPHAGVEYRRHAMSVIVRRALTQAREDSQEHADH